MVLVSVKLFLCSLWPFLVLVEEESLLSPELGPVTCEHVDEERPRLVLLELAAQPFVAFLAFSVVHIVDFDHIVCEDVVFSLKPCFRFVAVYPGMRNIRIGLGEHHLEVV